MLILMISVFALAVSLTGCAISLENPFSKKGKILMAIGQCIGVISLAILFSLHIGN